MKENYTLNDKYEVKSGIAFMSGTQAIIKLAFLQKEIDKNNNLDTAGFISGYRGSPLGGLDQALWNIQDQLKSNDIVFQPGVNEELAATACWGTQQLHLNPENSLKDGVFSFWYAKGPGVDRSCDALKHANMAGTSPFGGVVAIAGDDHIAKSSSVAHQSDHIFKACGIPVFFPSSVQEILDFGLHAIALSRFSGLWTSLKTIQEVVESTSTVIVDAKRIKPRIPDFKMPSDGLHIRLPDSPLAQEARLMDYKWYAALAYIKENKINYHVYQSEKDKFGIISSGKAYNETLQALQDLGLSEDKCKELGIRLYKVGVVWPLEPSGIREFATGLEEILVIEEKRQLIEYQIKEQLYGWRADVRPNVLGKFNEIDGDYSGGEWSMSNPSEHWLLSAKADLCSLDIAKAIYKRLEKLNLHHGLNNPLCEDLKRLQDDSFINARNPWFCSGCPHNTSTKLPEGSRALAGIGCHYMAQWMDRNTQTFTQMGGEGVSWVGQSPFSKEKHVFVNLGDGTYYHSGLLAIRQSISAKVNVTYKILYNNAVAMTGGQPVEGSLSVESIVTELYCEGVKKVIVVAEDTEQYKDKSFTVYKKEDILKAQNELKEIDGCTVLIYDQMCATEKRRQIKKGKQEAKNKRAVINTDICEGCGDCSTQSNCISVEPAYTNLGIKRAINQNSCNEDLSCVQGFCPSFMTFENAKVKVSPKVIQFNSEIYNLTIPKIKNNDSKIVIAGIGGTGVITTGQILGTAAYIDGKYCIIQEAAGLAQKGGATWCHVQISNKDKSILTTKVSKRKATLLFISDLVVGSQTATLEYTSAQHTIAVVNSANISTSEFIINKSYPIDNAEKIMKSISGDFKEMKTLNFSSLSKILFKDSLYCNMMQVGFAFQEGLLNISLQSIEKAIETNAVQIANNKLAFKWGRIFSQYPQAVKTIFASQDKPIIIQKNIKSEDFSAYIKKELSYYQDEAYANYYENIYLQFKDKLTNQQLISLSQNIFKALRVKDEYEVCRLMTLPQSLDKMANIFEPGAKSYYNIAPPFLGTKKIKVGTWIAPIFKATSKLKFLRGTFLDVFKYQNERKKEAKIKDDYIALLMLMKGKINTLSHQDIDNILAWPQYFKGFGHIKFSKEKQAYEKLNEFHTLLK